MSLTGTRYQLSLGFDVTVQTLDDPGQIAAVSRRAQELLMDTDAVVAAVIAAGGTDITGIITNPVVVVVVRPPEPEPEPEPEPIVWIPPYLAPCPPDYHEGKPHALLGRRCVPDTNNTALALLIVCGMLACAGCTKLYLERSQRSARRIAVDVLDEAKSRRLFVMDQAAAEKDAAEKYRMQQRETLDTLKEIHEIGQELKRELAAALKSGGIDLNTAFEALDVDGNGTVDHDEFREGMKALKVALSAAQIESLIDVFDEDNDGEIDYREFAWSVQNADGKPRLADLWRAGGAGWVTAAVGSQVHLHPTAKPYGCLAFGSTGEIVAVNDKAATVSFSVKCLKTGKVSAYKSEALMLEEEQPEEQPDTPPDTPPDPSEAPRVSAEWACERCGKFAPASQKLCAVCGGRLRPAGLVGA